MKESVRVPVGAAEIREPDGAASARMDDMPIIIWLFSALAVCASGSWGACVLHRRLRRMGVTPADSFHPGLTGGIWAVVFALALAAWLADRG